MTTVAVIGAGPSGIVAAKYALECGLKPTIFEKNDKIGGVWNPDVGAAWASMRTNLSYLTCMFSDFPWDPVPTNPFPTSLEMYSYLTKYIKHFNLEQCIRLQASVHQVQQQGAKWLVTWTQSSTEQKQVFDNLIVASGIFSQPHLPDIEGLKTFAGRIRHAHEYRDTKDFVAKKVAVVGNAFSGTEIAQEIASVAKSVLLVGSHPYIILPRLISGKTADTAPLDINFYSRDSAYTSAALDPQEANKRKNGYLHTLSRQSELPQELQVKSDLASPAQVIISDGFLDRYKQRQIRFERTPIQRIHPAAIEFTDGTKEECDEIVFATGYKPALSYFSTNILQNCHFDPHDSLQPLLLHQATFPEQLTNIGFVGMYRGPYFGVIELQARWVNMVLAKIIAGPTQQEISEGVEKERKIKHLVPRPQFPHGDYVMFAEGFAKAIGILPNWEQLKVDNPPLYDLLWTQPFMLSHYSHFGKNGKLDQADIDQITKQMGALKLLFTSQSSPAQP